MNVERLRRSVLLVPASDRERVAAAAASEADAVMLDLEDTVARAVKPRALDQAVEAVGKHDFGYKEVIVRVNALNTMQGRRDLEAIVAARPHAICLPKIATAADLLRAEHTVGELEARHGLGPGAIRFHVMLETASGVLHASEIARSSLRIDAVLYGGGDYTRETQGTATPDRAEQLFAMTLVLLAARTAFLDPIDSAALGVNEAAVVKEAQQARALGYGGKTIMNPRHVDVVHNVFTPGREEVERAQRVIKAYQDAEAAGVGVLEIDGHVVDAAQVRIARRIVRQVEMATAQRRREGA